MKQLVLPHTRKRKADVMVVWSLRMPPSVVSAVKRAAKAEGKTATDIVRDALAKRLPKAKKVGK